MLPVIGKRDCADMLKRQVLRWEEYPALSGWVQRNQKAPYKRRQEELEDRVIQGLEWCPVKMEERDSAKEYR